MYTKSETPPSPSETPAVQRVSALYQYHNAPEVAPAHGLEYDDNIYPSSDKYPVIRDMPFGIKHNKYRFENDSKPPRIIFGMKIRTFLVVALIMVCIIVGAAVGGGVGGMQLRSTGGQSSVSAGSSLYASSNMTAASSVNQSALPTSIFSAPTPTYTPLSDCPASNDTLYVSSYASKPPGSVASHIGLKFTKYCSLSNPLSLDGATNITEAFVYSFSDCIEVCAGYNFWMASGNCTVAVYEPSGQRPGNCWVGNAGDFQARAPNATAQEIDVAVLQS